VGGWGSRWINMRHLIYPDYSWEETGIGIGDDASGSTHGKKGGSHDHRTIKGNGESEKRKGDLVTRVMSGREV